VKINDLIYAQCVTYIGNEEGKTLHNDVWIGGKTLLGWWRRPWWVQGRGSVPSYMG
jgi:hypothetical protein